MAYVVSPTEKDPEKQNRSIRNAHERLTEAEAAIDTVEAEVDALQALNGREVLTATRTYYVRTDGSNSNTGLADTAGGAFLTINKAIDTVAALDLATFDVTIQVRAGTYATPVVLKLCVGTGTVTLLGEAGVIVSTTSADAITATSVGRNWVISTLKVTVATSGSGIVASGLTQMSVTGIEFGACVANQIRAFDGAIITATGNYSITGGAVRHSLVSYGGILNLSGRTVTLTGTPAFTIYAEAQTLGAMNLGSMTFSGSATGQRYNASVNGIINTGGGGATYLPGNAAGAVATQGLYN
jgi:hypothetical protein